ncbi:hypothetical protein GIW05_11490, partial [Pseudomonas syringae]|nr:hypothetical protein [Pseudomonas syringae]
PPDQRQDSAVTNVALCVVSATAREKHFCGSGCGLDYRANAEHWHDSHSQEQRALAGAKRSGRFGISCWAATGR